MRKTQVLLLLAFIALFTRVSAQHYEVETQSFVYKQVDTVKLTMEVYRPSFQGNAKLPAIVFFFGGGWVSGTIKHFELQARYLASRGMVAFCVDYRVKSRHNTSPFECVKDANSAMRYIRENANELGVDKNKIVAAGGSAGGHLAACTATIETVNESSDNMAVSPVPNALILFNPVVDTGKRGYGQEKLKGREFEISPVHHIKKGIPPTLIMHGKDDTTVPYENVVRFKSIMKQFGNKCKLVGYKNQVHGFFNFNKNPKYFKKTLRKTELFLEKLGYLSGSSWLNSYYKSLLQEASKS